MNGCAGRATEVRSRPIARVVSRASRASRAESVARSDCGCGSDGSVLSARADSTEPSDPQPQSLRATLSARLALLARDTTRAIGLLRTSVARPAQPFMVFYPQLSMAPERILL